MVGRHRAGRRGCHRAARLTWWDEWRAVVVSAAAAGLVWLGAASFYLHWALSTTTGGGR